MKTLLPRYWWHRVTAIVSVVVLLFTSGAAGQTPCPNPPPVNISSSSVPTDVCIPQNFPGIPFPFFDDFSWRSFIAVVWPALTGQRGAPDTTKTVGGSGPRVFETYKSLWEVFHDDGAAPAAWNSFDPPAFNACNHTMAFGDLVLASFSKFSNLGQAGFGSLVGPIVAQNTTYVRYNTGFNETEFTQMAVTNQWYLRQNLPTTITFQNGSLDVKSSWIDMTGMPHPERFYTRSAVLLDPDTGTCSVTTVGLVGLHIVQKTPSRPQWIWSSFEQVDNVPPAQTGAPGTFNFNDGTGTLMPSANPYTLDPLKTPTPPPFNITRVQPISSSTQKTNAAYQKALAGTPWQFYQLVMTQWPVPASTPANPGSPSFTFPGTGANTAFSNTTLETFDQGNIRTGCMACHTITQGATDFLWSLKDHAFKSNVPPMFFADKELKALQSLLRDVPQTKAMQMQKQDIETLKNKAKAQSKAKAKSKGK